MKVKRKRKGGSTKRKGGAYERKICKELSEWWTDGERQDVFWRTGGSGGRAKTRGRKGEQTYGQHGDIAASDPIGDPLTKLICIETKRGYNKFTMADFLDKPKKRGATQIFESWIHQAVESAYQGNIPFWMVIHQRDLRDPIVYFSSELFIEMDCKGANTRFTPKVHCHFKTKIRTSVKGQFESHNLSFVGMRMDRFLKIANKKMIEEIGAIRNGKSKGFFGGGDCSNVKRIRRSLKYHVPLSGKSNA